MLDESEHRPSLHGLQSTLLRGFLIIGLKHFILDWPVDFPAAGLES